MHTQLCVHEPVSKAIFCAWKSVHANIKFVEPYTLFFTHLYPIQSVEAQYKANLHASHLNSKFLQLSIFQIFLQNL